MQSAGLRGPNRGATRFGDNASKERRPLPVSRRSAHLFDQPFGGPFVATLVLGHRRPIGEMLVPLLRGPRTDLARSKDEQMVVGQVCASHPEAGIRDERAKRSNDELALRSPSERFERAVELLPAPGEGAHSFFRDRHVWFECAWRDTSIVIVVDADAVLLFGGAIGL